MRTIKFSIVQKEHIADGRLTSFERDLANTWDYPVKDNGIMSVDPKCVGTNEKGTFALISWRANNGGGSSAHYAKSPYAIGRVYKFHHERYWPLHVPPTHEVIDKGIEITAAQLKRRDNTFYWHFKFKLVDITTQLKEEVQS